MPDEIEGYRSPLDRATERLEEKLDRGFRARDKESRHIDTILRLLPQSGHQLAEALRILCEFSFASEDFALWKKAITAAGALSKPRRVGPHVFVEAVQQFGFEVVRET